ncbi:kinesin-like protein KIF25 [Hipposideros larvatus]
MPARCGRWGRFLEQRAQQLQRQVQAKEERIVELETENAVLHLKLAECQGRTGTRSGKATRPGPEQGRLQRTRSPWIELRHAAQVKRVRRSQTVYAVDACGHKSGLLFWSAV